jgi:hypothetical protein
MSFKNAQDETVRQSELTPMEAVWTRIREQLANERRRVYEEIKKYPTPIPACDAQFNYLLEERATLAQELNRLEALVREGLIRTDQIKRIEEFIASSNYINGESEQRIRSTLLSVSDGTQ